MVPGAKLRHGRSELDSPGAVAKRREDFIRGVGFQGARAAGYPDQELIAAIVGGRIDPKDSLPDGDVFFGSNHKSGLEAWRFVTKANEVEKEKRHLFGFPTGASPPIFPAMYAPTGAVHKKTRQGGI